MNRVEILIVEDNEDDVLLVEAFLPADICTVTWVESAASAREKLDKKEFDITLLDHGLPDTNSLSFLEELQSIKPQLPIIILTGREDETLAVSAIQKGASSYLLKDEIATHLWSTIQEIVNKKRNLADNLSAERFLDKAGGIYKVLLETMNDACLVVDLDGVITLANEALARLSDKPVSFLTGHNAFNLFPDKTSTQLLQAINQSTLLKQSQSSRFEGRLFNGINTTPVMIATRSLHAEDTGAYEGTLIMLNDVSELVVARETLSNLFALEQTQRIQLQSMIETSRDGIIWIDTNNRIAIINSQAINMLGLTNSPDDYTGVFILDFLAPFQQDHPEVVQQAFDGVLQQGPGANELLVGEVEVVPQKTIKWTSTPIQVDGGSIGWMVVMYDVTKERSLAKLREEFVHMMVHDLKNPLNAIYSALQFIEEVDMLSPEQTMSEHQLRMLNNATKSVVNTLDMVGDILMVYRLENNELPLNQDDLWVQFIVEEVIERSATMALNREIEVGVDIPNTVPSAWADPTLIKRVIQNLLDNALKFTQRGGKIEVSCRQLTDSHALQISVADNGLGINEEMHPYIFQKFVTNKQRRDGAGIGLAFCKLAVEAHRGKIWFETGSAGTTFHFTLPLFKAEQALPELQTN